MTSGGFVELDNNKLTRDELVMLGMREAFDEIIHECRAQASGSDNPLAKIVLEAWADRMAVRRDDLSVVLTRSALANKSGRFTALKGDN